MELIPEYGVPLLAQAFPPGDEALIVSSNLTLSSCNGLSTPAILDFRFIQGRIRLRPDVTVTFMNLILKHPRSRAGFGYDILLNSEGASVVSINTTRWLAACIPTTPQLIQQTLSQPRASHYPGTQDLKLVKEPLCIRDNCFDQYLLFVNYSAPNAAVAFAEGADEVGARRHGEVLLLTICTGTGK
jgi:hypothetical protein